MSLRLQKGNSRGIKSDPSIENSFKNISGASAVW